MQDSPVARVVALSAGLLAVAVLVVYAALGISLARPETSALSGLPAATQDQARDLYFSVRLAPWNGTNYTRLGMFFLANNRPDPAIEWLRRATVWSAEPWQAWYYLGLAERASHRPADAEAAFRKVLSLNPDYIAAKGQLAGLMIDRGQFAEAANAYSNLLRTSADQARVQQGLGTALFRLGDYPQAQQAFNQALAQFPYYGDTHAGLALTFEAEGVKERAAREVRLARHLRGIVPLHNDDPLIEQMESDFPTALSLLQAAVRGHDLHTSIETLEKGLSLDPGMAIGWEHLIGMYGQAHRPKDAERAWSKLAALDPNNVRSRLDLAVALIQAKDLNRATALMNEALAIDPSFADAHRILGLVAELAGNGPEAIRQFRTAFETDPALADAHVDLGIFLIRSGQTREAQAELLRALLPPCENPERTLAHEISGIKDPNFEQAFEQAVRAQAQEKQQLGLITFLNNRKNPAAARPIGLAGIPRPDTTHPDVPRQ
jgi:Tfp pilus assembly protein PilF